MSAEDGQDEPSWQGDRGEVLLDELDLVSGEMRYSRFAISSPEEHEDTENDPRASLTHRGPWRRAMGHEAEDSDYENESFIATPATDGDDDDDLFAALEAAHARATQPDQALGQSGKENNVPRDRAGRDRDGAGRPARRALAALSVGEMHSPGTASASSPGSHDGGPGFVVLDEYEVGQDEHSSVGPEEYSAEEDGAAGPPEELLSPRPPSPMPSPRERRGSADAESQSDEGGVLVEREIPVQGFRVLDQIGSGTYGKVYKVVSTTEDTGELFVLKQVPLDGLSQAEQNETINEAHFMIEIEDHENIVKHHSSFIEAGCLNMIMEYCGNGDLSKRIKAHRESKTRFEETFIWQVLIQVCSALEHLHEHRILHRDIKPENIFLDADDQVKVGDLGLGRLLSSQSKFAHSTVGTPLFFSPELCEEALYDERSDIWALGCLVYQMAALRPPFLASNQLALAKKIVSEDIKPISSHFSKDLHFLVHKMLEKDPQKRPDAKQILAYGPVRIRVMQAKIDLRERQLSSLHTQRECELLDSNALLKKQVEACKTEMREMRKSYEHLIAQARAAEQAANQRACALETQVYDLQQRIVLASERDPRAAAKTPALSRAAAQTPGSRRTAHKTPAAVSRRPGQNVRAKTPSGSAAGAVAISPPDLKTPQPVLATKPGRTLPQAQKMSADPNKKKMRARKPTTSRLGAAPASAAALARAHDLLPAPQRRIVETPVGPATKGESRRRSWTSSKAQASGAAHQSPRKTSGSATRGLGPARRVPSSFLTED